MSDQWSIEQVESAVDVIQKAEARADTLVALANIFAGLATLGAVAIMWAAMSAEEDDLTRPAGIAYAAASLLGAFLVRGALVALASNVETNAHLLRLQLTRKQSTGATTADPAAD